MEEIISYCGLVCKRCPIYIASREINKSKKKKMRCNIIDLCKTIYGVDYKFGDINDCDGCKSESGKLFSGCKNCKIRKCAAEKVIDNCAYCEDYVCKKLREIFIVEPNAKMRLDLIRKCS